MCRTCGCQDNSRQYRKNLYKAYKDPFKAIELLSSSREPDIEKGLELTTQLDPKDIDFPQFDKLGKLLAKLKNYFKENISRLARKAHMKLRRDRMKEGLPGSIFRYNPLTFDPNKWTWGLNVVPEEAKAAWGMRAQLSENGIWWCWDKSSLIGDADEKKRLVDVLDKTDIREMANEEVKRLIKTGLIHNTPTRPVGLTPAERSAWAEANYRDRPDEFVLAEKSGVIIVGNTQGSSGYLYLAAFFKPPGMGIAAVCEKCLNDAEEDAEICSKCNFRVCLNCQMECDECGEFLCKECGEIIPCKNNERRYKASYLLPDELAEMCDKYMCPSESCIEDAERCAACEQLLCEECFENNELCNGCEEKTCDSCHEKLYEDDEYEVEECGDCGSIVHPDCLDDCKVCKQLDEEEYDEEY